MNLESAKNRSEVIKNYAQIIGIIIAAFWTYYLFAIMNRPGLETRGTVTNSMTWFQLGETDKFLVDFHVGIENKGTTPFDISKIHVRAWEFVFDTQKEGLNYVDPESIRSGTPFFDKTYQLSQTSASSFPAHYPPGASVGNTFDWVVKPDCKKWLFFAADVYKQGEENAPTWSTYTWWQECPHPKSGSAPPNQSIEPTAR